MTSATIAGWVYIRGSCGTYNVCSIFSKGTSNFIGYNLEIDTASGGVYKVRLDLSDKQNVYGTSTIGSNQWYHIAATFDGTTVKIYVNGALQTSTAQTYIPTFNTTTARAGNANSNEDLPMNGYIDELGVWNRALTYTEISTLYNGGTGLTYP